jgi:hypothetical protein
MQSTEGNRRLGSSEDIICPIALKNTDCDMPKQFNHRLMAGIGAVKSKS